MGLDLTGIGSVASFAKGVVDRFFPPKMSEAERAQAEMQLQVMIEAREAALLDAQKSIIVAEMNQGDDYTKRARPTIVYAGLCFILMVHVLFPMFSYFTKETLPEISLPHEFWWAWTGVCSIWVMGRSFEKGGSKGKIVSAITGAGK